MQSNPVQCGTRPQSIGQDFQWSDTSMIAWFIAHGSIDWNLRFTDSITNLSTKSWSNLALLLIIRCDRRTIIALVRSLRFQKHPAGPDFGTISKSYPSWQLLQEQQFMFSRLVLNQNRHNFARETPLQKYSKFFCASKFNKRVLNRITFLFP